MRFEFEFTQSIMAFNKHFSSLGRSDNFLHSAQRWYPLRYTSPTAIAANY